MSLDTQQSIADCCVPSESERHTSREVERKSKAQRGGFFVAGPPQGKSSPSGMSLDTQQSIVDCCVPSESERHTSREVERKPKAQRGGFFCGLTRFQPVCSMMSD
ncbi:hypothetical protein [Alcaligenes sp. SMD-FA]|uniref:hypothetical protein n=1 Tax=Alcaligenes sp. SMD-FA TaxID=2991054 RepID=UPI002228074C|nr:hypothetical protein [Alcaligenes sp. SMD-FA]UYY88529.1 hypothetical protein OKX01_06485 [Alcaligenes sp. SMD-FA]